MIRAKRVFTLTGMRIVTSFKQVSSFAAWLILLVIHSGIKSLATRSLITKRPYKNRAAFLGST